MDVLNRTSLWRSSSAFLKIWPAFPSAVVRTPIIFGSANSTKRIRTERGTEMGRSIRRVTDSDSRIRRCTCAYAVIPAQRCFDGWDSALDDGDLVVSENGLINAGVNEKGGVQADGIAVFGAKITVGEVLQGKAGHDDAIEHD